MIELTLMRTFLAVYRSGTLTQAAQILGVSQPAVSQQLKALEGELGAPLFVRGARGVTPTPAAHAFAEDIAQPLDALERVARDRRQSATAHGAIRCGGPVELLQAAILPSLVAVIGRGFRLEAVTGPEDELLEALRAGKIDLVVARSTADFSELRFVFLFEDPLVMVSGPHWVDRSDVQATSSMGAAELAELPLIGTRSADDRMMWYLREALDTRLAETPAIIVSDLRSVLAVAIAGGGVAVVPRSLARAALDRGELVEWRAPRRPPMLSYCLALPVEQPSSPAVTAAVAELLGQTTTG